ncbi:MAG: 2-hydroxyacid dehydrogenase, partial [Rhodoferax sp.]|nr:2-hydroxyacid dehydrogenase [Rhodoferax sp.]
MTAQNRPDTRPEIVAIGGMADWMLAELRLRYRVHDLAAATDRTGLLAQAAQARAAVTTGAVGIEADTVRRLPQLAMLACFGTGYDKVDRAALAQRGIALSNTP